MFKKCRDRLCKVSNSFNFLMAEHFMSVPLLQSELLAQIFESALWTILVICSGNPL